MWQSIAYFLIMINHINSLTRESLNWFTPIDMAKFTLDKNTLKKLNLKKIPTNEIQLTPKLLKKSYTTFFIILLY